MATNAQIAALTNSVEKIKHLLGADFERLHPHEVETLRLVMKHADDLIEVSEYRKARRLLLSTWRKWIIGFAAVVAAIALSWDKIKSLLYLLMKGSGV